MKGKEMSELLFFNSREEFDAAVIPSPERSVFEVVVLATRCGKVFVGKTFHPSKYMYNLFIFVKRSFPEIDAQDIRYGIAVRRKVFFFDVKSMWEVYFWCASFVSIGFTTYDATGNPVDRYYVPSVLSAVEKEAPNCLGLQDMKDFLNS